MPYTFQRDPSAYTFRGLTGSRQTTGAGGGSALSSGGSTRRAGTSDFLSAYQQVYKPALESSRDRGLPERADANLMDYVDTAVRAPAHALERPIAALNRAAGLLTGESLEKGPIDSLLGAIGSIGVGDPNTSDGVQVGDLVNALGSGLNTAMSIPAAMWNSTDYQLLKQGLTEGWADDHQMGWGKSTNGSLFGIGSRPMTFGEYKAELQKRGFNTLANADGEPELVSFEELVRRTDAKGKIGELGFGDRMVNEHEVSNLAFNMIADPTNLLAGAGAFGKLAKVGKFFGRAGTGAGRIAAWAVNPALRMPVRIGRNLASEVNNAWGIGYMRDVVEAGLRQQAIPTATMAAKAISGGYTSAASIKGLGMVLRSPQMLGRAGRTVLLPGEGSLARRYARGAMRLDLGLLGVEFGSGGISELTGDPESANNNIVSGFFDSIHDASQAILADKPLSDDQTFVLAAAFLTPSVEILKEDVGAVRSHVRGSLGSGDPALWAREILGYSSLRGPKADRKGVAALYSAVPGGQKGFARLLSFVDDRIAFNRLVEYAPFAQHFGSFDEAMSRSAYIGHVVREKAQAMRAAGDITPRMRIDTFREWGRGRYRTILAEDGRVIRNMREPVDFELTGEQLMEQWGEYVATVDSLAKHTRPVGEAILGRQNRLTAEDLDLVKAAVQSATVNGKVDPTFVISLIRKTPGILEDPMLTTAQRRFWSDLTTLGIKGNGQSSGGYAATEILSELDNLRRLAPSSRELYHEAAAAEAAAPLDPSPPAAAGPVTRGGVRKITSMAELQRRRDAQNGMLRSLTREYTALEDKLKAMWTSRGQLRSSRPRTKIGKETSPNRPTPALRKVAQAYNAAAGLPKIREGEYWPADPDFGARTGLAYEQLPAFDDSPATRAAYKAFGEETMAQWDALMAAGYTIEPWTPELAAKHGEQPYNSSSEMQADVAKNKHLYYFQGGEPHPLLNEPLNMGPGMPANLNEMFRAVHDIMTHAQEGFQFGARGEINAAIKHAQMYSPVARRAMLTETHGQNSWVNFGPHNPQRLKAADRPYAKQKVALLPDEIVQEFEDRFIGRTSHAGRKAREMAEAMGLTGDESSALATVMAARAEAWSRMTGKSPTEYLNRFKVEKGGRTAKNALLQRDEIYRDAILAEQRQSMAKAIAAKTAYADMDAAARARAVQRRQAERAARMTPEQIEARNVLLAEILGQDYDSPAAQTPVEAALETGVSDRATLEPLLNAPPPAELVNAGHGAASPLEWHKLEDGTDFAIPGGLDGVFSLWDAWRLKQQQIDPNLIPQDVRVKLYDKLFRSQERSLADPVDNFNRAALSLLSPNTRLLDNEALTAIYRVTEDEGVEGLRRLADMTPEEFDAMVPEGIAPGFPTNHRHVQTLARRMADNPEYFAIREGETTVQFAERMMSVIPGAGPKVANFLAMLGDPFNHSIGTIDKRMVERLTSGELKGYLPEGLTDLKQSQFRGHAIRFRLKDGSVNPEVPAHLRDVPEEWLVNNTVYTFDPDSPYMKFNQALMDATAAKYGDLPFGPGGTQWMEWDLERGILEPHTTIWPGADLLPKMDPQAISVAKAVARDAGYYRTTKGKEPYGAEGVFFQEDDVARAATEFKANGEIIIRALKDPNVSSAIHELSHVWRRDLPADDLAILEAHYKVRDGAWEPGHEEQFARQVERYFRDGKAPTAELEGVFARFRLWLSTIYRAVSRSPLSKQIHPEVRGVMDRMFAPADGQTFSHQVTAAIQSGDLSMFGKGDPDMVDVASDIMVADTRMVTLVRRDAAGNPQAAMEVRFEAGTERAASDGVQYGGTPEGMRALLEYAGNQNWDIDQALTQSRRLTDEQRAVRNQRWADMRAADEATIAKLKAEAKEHRAGLREIDRRAAEIRTVAIDPSFLGKDGNPTVDPASMDALKEQTIFVQENFPALYKVEKAPRLAYHSLMNDNYVGALLQERSNLARVLFDYGPLASVTRAIDTIIRPVEASRMAKDARQMVYNKLLPMGATTSEVKSFLDLLRTAPEGWTVTRNDNPLFRGTTSLPPNKISQLARQAFAGNDKLVDAITAKYGGLDRLHVLLDESFNSAVRRIDLKELRGLKVGKLERIFRKGYWAWGNMPGLKHVGDTSRMVSKVFYPIFRFQLDIRWQALNMIEADVIALFRDGVRGTRFSRRPPRTVDRGGQIVNLSDNALAFHSTRGGVPVVQHLDPQTKEQIGTRPVLPEDIRDEAGTYLLNRNYGPVITKMFDSERLDSVRKVLDELPANDTAIQLLEKKFGKNKASWGEQLDEMLYSFDRRGVRNTVLEEVRRVKKFEKWSQDEFDQMMPFVDKLIERNQQTFDDIVQMQLGNINRSRLERTMNSFWLYWPISYQIKATKWMVKTLTERSFGAQNNLGGAWTLDHAADKFREQYENDPEFARMIDDNEDIWFAANMVMPIVPWDWGVSLNRHVRYVGGNILHLWPEYASVDTPGDWVGKTIEMGPVYSVELAKRMLDLFGGVERFEVTTEQPSGQR